MALAVIEVENQVVLGDEVARLEAKEASGLVDGLVRTFEFDEGTDGSFVEIDEEILGPFMAGGKLVGSAKFFVAEPAAEAQTFKDFLEGFRVGEDRLEFFPDFVAAVGGQGGRADGESFGRGFEGEQVPLVRVS